MQPLEPLPPQSNGQRLDAQRAATEPSASGELADDDGRPPDDNKRATYRVAPGDSLWSIAEAQLTPAADNARIAREVNRLWELNADRIATGQPDLLMVGTVLRLA